MKNKYTVLLIAICFIMLMFCVGAYNDIGPATQIQDDTIVKADFADEDWGDMTVSSNSVTLDTGVVADNEIDYSAVTLDDFDYQTAWRVFYSNTAGDVTELALGLDGQAFVANGTSSAPGWEYLPRQNLLTNTQWIACFNSDSAKGLGEVEYDNPNSITPTIGEVFTGGTSSATGVLIEYDTNTLVLGRCAGRFHNDERVNGGTSDFGADINLPNSAAGVDLIQNGEFSVDTDPPPGWTALASAILTTEAGGKVGNCLMVTEGGGANPYAYQAITTVSGNMYYLVGYCKAGTQATYRVRIGTSINDGTHYDTGNLEETAGDWSTSVTRYFKATGTTTYITLMQICDIAAATTMYFDEISCYEVSPGCTGTNALAFDGWHKDATLDVYREHSGTNTKDGSFYAAKFVPSAGNDYILWPSGRYSKEEFHKQLEGRTQTVAAWSLTSTASHVRLEFIENGSVVASSSYHTGGGSYEWIEKTYTWSATLAGMCGIAIRFTQSSGIAYISQPILVFGSSIGQGNYVPESDRRIYAENGIDSQTFDDKTDANGFSDVSITELCLESDSLACIGKGVKAVLVVGTMNDSGSAGTSCFFGAGYDLSYHYSYMCSPYGLANDTIARVVGFIPCNSSSNYEYYIDATGGSTFDINNFKYIGVEWR